VILSLLLAFAMFPHSSPEGECAGPLADADKALVRIDYQDAEQCLENALVLAPNDPAIHWKLARVHVLSAEVCAGDEHLGHLRAAESYARQSIAMDTTVAEGYAWLAAALGYRALLCSPKDQLALLHEILGATERAILLDPADDIAYSIRGSTFRALGRVGWFERGIATLFFGGVPEGGFVDAETSLREAVRLAPDIMRHRYELAILLLDMGREDEGRQMLIDAARLPIRIASDIPRLETIHELLAEEHPSSPDAGGRGGTR
jgi:tetratricopeptide (TPR) repeat protein